MPPRLPLSQIIIYALGQLGWSLAAFGAANLLVYFYLPPGEGKEAIFPAFIFQGAVWGVATLVGLINFGGRFFDAITDPLVALWSDRRPAGKLGKRKTIMAIAALPCALFSFLMFFPPAAEPGWLNAVWLTGAVLLFYFFLTLYLIPYNALISELGHHPPDRMTISTAISVTFALGFLIGGSVFAFQDMLSDGRTPVRAFQLAMGVYACLALLLMLMPVFLLQENRYAHQPATAAPSRAEDRRLLRRVLADANFRIFLWSDLMYWLALTFIQLGVSYFLTVLMGFEAARTSLFLAVSFIGSFALYWPVNVAVSRWGKRRMVMAAFGVFGAVFGLTALQGLVHLPAEPLFWLLAVGAAFPLAVFGIVPNALIADLVYAYSEQSGEQPSGMFYAIRSFMMKVGISLANLIFPSLLLLGKSAASSLGVQLAAWAALLACIAGAVLFSRMHIAQK